MSKRLRLTELSPGPWFVVALDGDREVARTDLTRWLTGDMTGEVPLPGATGRTVTAIYATDGENFLPIPFMATHVEGSLAVSELPNFEIQVY